MSGHDFSRKCLGVALAGAVLAQGCQKDGEDGSRVHVQAQGSAQGPTQGGELPELSRLGPFTLKDQGGTPVTLATFEGKVWVAAFMFTRCPTICPEITRRMKGVQEEAVRRKVPLHLVSFSVDPDHDTPEVLTAYAAKYGADLSTWSFLTGDYETIASTAEQGFKVGVSGRADPNAEHMGITHGSHLVLVDRKGAIRGYYRTTDDKELERLFADVSRVAN